MTANVFTELRCDKPKCRVRFTGHGGRPVAAGHSTARKWAAAQGWTYRTIHPPIGDFCPEHSDDPGETS